MGSTSIQQ